MHYRCMVFTDLDGTLLDHESYDHAPAAPALARLRALGVPLILASSKTAAEIAPLHAELGLGAWPAIVENGAGLYEPGGEAAAGDDYLRLRRALGALPAAQRTPFRGFGDMTDAQVAELTGLTPAAACRARQRQYSEPGLWQGDAAGEAQFLAALAPAGVTGRRGGRFLTLSFGRTKADAMAELLQRLGPAASIALGDAPNDAEMLAAADRGVWIRNDHGTPPPVLPGEAEGRIRRTDLAGPAGWNRAVLDLIDELVLAG